MVGMCILPQVISASSCERNWSADGHIHSKFCNKLGPETNEKLVFVYSKSKMAATVREADELKMFAWDNEDVQPSLVSCQALPGQPDTLSSLGITESSNHRIVEARILPNRRIARSVRTIRRGSTNPAGGCQPGLECALLRARRRNRSRASHANTLAAVRRAPARDVSRAC